MKPPVYHSFLSLSFLAAVLLIATHNSQAQTASAAGVEEYILAQLTAGNVADLKHAFPKETDRVVSAAFLEDLIINPDKKYKIHRNGIQIRGAVVPDFLNLNVVEVPVHLSLSESQFGEVKFFQAAFKKGLSMRFCHFDGKAYFSYAVINGGFSVTGSYFKTEAKFEAMRVSGPAFFDKTIFNGPVSFAYTNIDGVFQVGDAAFNHWKDDADQKTEHGSNDRPDVVFNSIRITSGFFLQKTRFEGSVDFINVKIGDNLEGNEACFNNPTEEITFNKLSATGLYLQKAVFEGPADFANARINGLANFDGTEFKKQPVLSNFQYDAIISHDSLLTFVKNSNSDYTAYTQLETFLQKSGRTGEADSVFIEKKRLERSGMADVTGKLRSLASEALQGFGRKPGRVFLWDLAVFGLGVIIFTRKRMVPKVRTDTESNHDVPTYKAWAYSLTLFAPTIDSKYTNQWEPAPQHTKTKAYVYIHKGLGWALTLVTVGVWTGTFK